MLGAAADVLHCRSASHDALLHCYSAAGADVIDYCDSNGYLPLAERVSLFMAADVLMHTPCCTETLNLNPLEYVYVQSHMEQLKRRESGWSKQFGVTVLSSFTTAHEIVNGALLVNPYRVTEVLKLSRRRRPARPLALLLRYHIMTTPPSHRFPHRRLGRPPAARRPRSAQPSFVLLEAQTMLPAAHLLPICCSRVSPWAASPALSPALFPTAHLLLSPSRALSNGQQ